MRVTTKATATATATLTRESASLIVGKFLGSHHNNETIVSFTFGGDDLLLSSEMKGWKLLWSDIFNVARAIESNLYDSTEMMTKFDNKFLDYDKATW
jgi:hypothetical protein